MKQRYYSLDVFRGATVALMILVNNPGNWDHIYAPLDHAPWHGLTPTDLVFPFFLFAVGNAMAFTMPRLQAGGDALFWKKVIKRTLLIFGVGLFLNWWPFVSWKDGHLALIHWVTPNPADPAHPYYGVRILGVLQRIAIAYFFAAVIIYYLRLRGAFYLSLVLLLGYWALCYLANPADPYSRTGWFGTDIDKMILHIPHMYKGEGYPFDPEGLMSAFAAIVQVIFGYMVGYYIQNKGKNEAPAPPVAAYNPYEMITGLFVAGVALLVTGFCWDMVFPINKKIWTSSYTVYTTGLATVTLATMIYMIEIRQVKGWLTRFFDVFGKNPLFVFALSAFLPKGLRLIRIPNHLNDKGQMTYISPWNWLYERVLIHIPGAPENGSLAYALCVITFMWAICYWLDKKKIYIKV